MNAQFIRFGEIEIDGTRYTEDIVIDRGATSFRDKGASRQLKAEWGHTPLSGHEKIPWDCKTLIVGTGVYGKLPITEDVLAMADKRGVELVVAPTEQACALLTKADTASTNVILHLTC